MLEYEDIDITPVVAGWIEAIQADKWFAAEAIAEAIDNSFGSDHGNADNVWVTWNSSDRTLTILDDGMGMESPGLLLRLGEGRGRSPGDIGRYGSGGTMLCIWLAEKVDVHTIRNGQYAMAHADWDLIARSGKWQAPQTKWAHPGMVSSVPYELGRIGHGTMLILRVPRRRSIQPGHIVKALGDLYGPGLQKGKRIRFRHHTRNQNGAYQEVMGSWSVPAGAVRAIAYVKTLGRDVRLDVAAWIDPTATREESTVRIAFGHRVIKVTAEPFGEFSGLHVKALVDLGPGAQDYLTQTKNDFADDEFYKDLVATIHGTLQSLLAEAQTQAQQMLVQGITLNLENALTGLFDPGAEVPASLLSPEPRYTWQKQDTGEVVPTIVPVRDPVTKLAPNRDGSQTTKGSRRGGPVPLRIVLSDGSSMSGGLFSAQLKRNLDKADDDHILVELNQDHEHVQAAIDRGSPGAERLLWHTVLDAVAALIVDDERLTDLMLPRQLVRAMEDRSLQSRFSKLMAYLLAQKGEKTA